MPPLEGEVPNEREAEGFVRKLSKKTPQSARSGCQLPFQGSQGGFAARVARLATHRVHCNFQQKAYLLFPQNMIQSAKTNVEILPTGIPQQTSFGKPAERQGRKVQVSNPDFSGMID